MSTPYFNIFVDLTNIPCYYDIKGGESYNERTNP
nr:MAG TPA: hypothetical protein [Caudoviricetes sp.]